ncbi:MAG: hypothetical protein JWO98_2128 [Frankiales bacterium]|nr:hypothetical protein [Frankiales bacterium]
MEAGSRNFELGYDFSHIVPIPHDADSTAYVSAGAVELGLEYRSLDQDTQVETIAPDGTTVVRQVELVESGLSIHVFDAAKRTERLRFDDLDDDPHYHYLDPGKLNHLVVYDRAANGDMMEWAMAAIGANLRAMLTEARAEELAAQVDDALLASALQELRGLVAKHRSVPAAG